jgi:hypothetical protein
MDFDHESSRLQQLYEEKNDDELFRMYASRDDLTDVAQDALASVMRARNLDVAPHHDAEAVASQDASTVAIAVEAHEALLWTFGDMFQARRAIDLLEQSQIEYKLIDLSQGNTVSMYGQSAAWLQLVVGERDYGLAKKILHDGMGLFPAAEVDAPSADAGPLDDLMSVLMLDSETEMVAGVAAAQALARAGVSFVWHDGRDFPEGLADAKTVSIEVRPAAYDMASNIVEACMDALPKRR